MKAVQKSHSWEDQRIVDLEQVSVFGGRRRGVERRPSLLSHSQGFNWEPRTGGQNTGLKAVLSGSVFWNGSCQPWVSDTQEGKSWRAGNSPLSWPRLPSHPERGERPNIHSHQQWCRSFKSKPWANHPLCRIHPTLHSAPGPWLRDHLLESLPWQSGTRDSSERQRWTSWEDASCGEASTPPILPGHSGEAVPGLSVPRAQQTHLRPWLRKERQTAGRHYQQSDDGRSTEQECHQVPHLFQVSSINTGKAFPFSWTSFVSGTFRERSHCKRIWGLTLGNGRITATTPAAPRLSPSLASWRPTSDCTRERSLLCVQKRAATTGTHMQTELVLITPTQSQSGRQSSCYSRWSSPQKIRRRWPHGLRSIGGRGRRKRRARWRREQSWHQSERRRIRVDQSWRASGGWQVSSSKLLVRRTWWTLARRISPLHLGLKFREATCFGTSSPGRYKGLQRRWSEARWGWFICKQASRTTSLVLPQDSKISLRYLTLTPLLSSQCDAAWKRPRPLEASGAPLERSLLPRIAKTRLTWSCLSPLTWLGRVWEWSVFLLCLQPQEPGRRQVPASWAAQCSNWRRGSRSGSKRRKREVRSWHDRSPGQRRKRLGRCRSTCKTPCWPPLWGEEKPPVLQLF